MYGNDLNLSGIGIWRKDLSMKSMDSATELEHIEKLVKEAETLKIRLEDERQKLNDVTRK